MMIQTQLLLKKIVPEFIELFDKRYTILRNIYSMQPVGRRTLASSLGIGERIVRTETTFLREAGLLDIRPTGMEVTYEGEKVLEGLRELTHQLKGLHQLETQIEDVLKLDRVLIVPGDVDEDDMVLADIGKAAAGLLKDIIQDKDIIAVTGGTTVGSVAHALSQTSDAIDVLVIPARGGMGGNVEYQSNTLAAMFAKKLGGRYRLLHVPGQLSPEATETLLNEPDVKSIIQHLKSTDILIYGMGRAEDMAARRNLGPEYISILQTGGAIAEAFGYFFNRHGEIVLSSNPIGLNIDDLKTIPNVIGVVGGKQKALAIMAVLLHCPHSILVMDEGAAHEILRLARAKTKTF